MGDGEDGNINVPRWAVAILLALMLNLVAVVYGAGAVVTRVSELERRMVAVEQQIILLIGKIHYKELADVQGVVGPRDFRPLR